MENQTNVQETAQRPKTITIVCWFFLIVACLPVIPLLFMMWGYSASYSATINQFGTWYPPFMILSFLGGLVGGIGIMKMKKWGAYVYIATQAIIIFILYNEHLITGLVYLYIVILLSFVGVVLFHLKKMK